ncbi:MAG: GLUG motif-containing protein, partial [Intestinibacter sp.]
MYLRETVKKPISVILTILMVLAYCMPYQLSYSYADIAYGFQGTGGNTLKMLSYDGEITVVEQTSEHYLNSINTKINGGEDIVFGVTMSSGINAFGDGTNFRTNCMPYIKIYDSEWKNVVAEYDGGNGALKYISFDSSTSTINIGVEKNILPNGDYILVFGKEVCGNNTAKNLGIPVAFQFTTYGGIEGESLGNLIKEIQEFLDSVTIGNEPGQYPSKDDLEAVIADAKSVDENTESTEDEIQAAKKALQKSFEIFKESRIVKVSDIYITSKQNQTVKVGDTGTITVNVIVAPDEDQYKGCKFTSSDNISIDSETGEWEALYAGEAYIKVTSAIDSQKYYTYEFEVEEDTAVVDTSWYDPSQSIYKIKNGAQLAGLACLVNGKKGAAVDFADKTILITGDIALTEAQNSCLPIGSKSLPFRGNLQGTNHIISGLNLNVQNEYTALIGYLDKGSVSDLTVKGNITGSLTKMYCAAIIGYANASTIENCTNEVTGTLTGMWNGGIVGYLNDSTIKNCTNKAEIKFGSRWSGGIIGYASNSSISNCTNEADLTFGGESCGG